MDLGQVLLGLWQGPSEFVLLRGNHLHHALAKAVDCASAEFESWIQTWNDGKHYSQFMISYKLP